MGGTSGAVMHYIFGHFQFAILAIEKSVQKESAVN